MVDKVTLRQDEEMVKHLQNYLQRLNRQKEMLDREISSLQSTIDVMKNRIADARREGQK